MHYLRVLMLARWPDPTAREFLPDGFTIAIGVEFDVILAPLTDSPYVFPP
jgi:hypothetical protein